MMALAGEIGDGALFIPGIAGVQRRGAEPTEKGATLAGKTLDDIARGRSVRSTRIAESPGRRSEAGHTVSGSSRTS